MLIVSFSFAWAQGDPFNPDMITLGGFKDLTQQYKSEEGVEMWTAEYTRPHFNTTSSYYV
jgi:hypothetical protein